MSISVPALFQRVAQMSSGCAVVWLDPRSPKAWCKAEYVPHTRSRMAFEGAVMNPSQFRINVYHADMDNIAARYSEFKRRMPLVPTMAQAVPSMVAAVVMDCLLAPFDMIDTLCPSGQALYEMCGGNAESNERYVRFGLGEVMDDAVVCRLVEACRGKCPGDRKEVFDVLRRTVIGWLRANGVCVLHKPVFPPELAVKVSIARIKRLTAYRTRSDAETLATICEGRELMMCA